MGTIRVEDEELPHCFRSPRPDEESEQLQQPVQHILIYGDSLVAGACGSDDKCSPFGAELAKILEPPIAVWVCGLIGLSVSEMTTELEAARIHDAAGRCGSGLQNLVRRRARERNSFDVALILAGAHDLQAGNVSPEDVADGILQLHAACHQEDLRTIAVSIPPAREFQSEEGKLTSHYRTWRRANELLREGVEEGAFARWVVTYVDLATRWPTNEEESLKLFDAGGIGLSAEGSDLLARIVGEAISERVSPLCRPLRPEALVAAGQRGTPRADEVDSSRGAVGSAQHPAVGEERWRTERARWLQVQEADLMPLPRSFEDDGRLRGLLLRRRGAAAPGGAAATPQKLSMVQREELQACLRATQIPFPQPKHRLPLTEVIRHASKAWEVEASASHSQGWWMQESWFDGSWLQALPEITVLCADGDPGDRGMRSKCNANSSSAQRQAEGRSMPEAAHHGKEKTCQEVQPRATQEPGDHACQLFPLPWFRGW
mmetsp:Transcript_36616/g.85822  ORF Transcript_36616/g.85822 Transcript_36616/m.85822 type:complete len:489 (+) Transcript_36616:77-1543(+)